MSEKIEACPHCGHPMVPDEIGRSLPRISRRVYETVRDAGAAGISSREIAARVYADDATGGPTTNSPMVLICRQINPRIARYGLRIVGRRGPGALHRLVRTTS